jgi:acyl CoA:acetate/3-ketoacid CoA transferase alpha subunit
MFTQAVQCSELTVIEETEASLSTGLRAKAAGVGFMPSRAWLGTDLHSLRPDVKTVLDPYSGDVLTAFPAIRCDLAALHGLEGDENGTVRLNANLGVDAELIYAADRVMVTVERLLDAIEPDGGVIVPPPGIDYIAHAPNGAYPTSCYPDYRVDGGELMRYVEYCNAGKFQVYLSEVLEI